MYLFPLIFVSNKYCNFLGKLFVIIINLVIKCTDRVSMNWKVLCLKGCNYNKNVFIFFCYIFPYLVMSSLQLLFVIEEFTFKRTKEIEGMGWYLNIYTKDFQYVRFSKIIKKNYIL